MIRISVNFTDLAVKRLRKVGLLKGRSPAKKLNVILHYLRFYEGMAPLARGVLTPTESLWCDVFASLELIYISSNIIEVRVKGEES